MGMAVKRDVNPFIIKVGVALALSFAGFLYTRFRVRKIRPSLPPRSPRSSDHGTEAESKGVGVGRMDELHAIQTKRSSSSIVSCVEEKHEHTYPQKIILSSPTVGYSPSSKHSGDNDEFLLPEFSDLVKGFDVADTNSRIYLKKDICTARSEYDTPRMVRSGEKDGYEQEIMQLRDTVRTLQERERNLEVQLLEYYGLKEQETAVMELQNRLRLNDMEAKLFKLRIDTLQAENQRLRTQVADNAKVIEELESARGKIKHLKKKLRLEAQQNKEQILNLKERVSKLQDEEHMVAAYNSDVDSKLQKLKDLEREAENLRKSNAKLELENLELSRKLESTQLLASSMLEDKEAVELREIREMSESLKQKNEDLVKKMEQLEADRCADAEELVYLKWLNACLRYELRHYQPSSGKTVAKHLSKSLSPNSEEKAKQLILEYANGEVMKEKGSAGVDFDDLDQWSTPQTYATDAGDLEDFEVESSTSHKEKRHKFFSKLRRFLRGKDIHSQYEKDSHSLIQTSAADRTGYTEDNDSPRCSSSISTIVDAGPDWQSNRYTASSQSSSRTSIDMSHRIKSPKEEDMKEPESLKGFDGTTPYKHRRWVSSKEGTNEAEENLFDQNSEYFRKSNLVRYAAVLRDSRAGTLKGHKKASSVSNF